MRPIARASFLAAVLVLAFFSVGSDAEAATYPAQVLDLTDWKETLPTGASEKPTEIVQASLSAFAAPPYFQVNAAGDGVQFRAPVNGVTTSGSGYPRSELREMTDNGTKNASWSTTSGTHALFIDQAITAVPQTKKHVVAGQIHDSEDDIIVIRLEYPKLFVDINGKTGPTLDPNYTLGKRFTVGFVATEGKIKVYYNGSSTPVYTLSKSGSGNYFKAGAYTQSNCSKETVCSDSNYGEVIIYGLAVRHESANDAPILLASASVPADPASAPTPTPAPMTPEPTTPTPAQVSVGTSFEAESGVVTSPMKIASASSASGGKYVVQTTSTGEGSIRYSVVIPATGQYQLNAKVIAPNGSSNSVYYSLDGGDMTVWHFPDNLKNWTWASGPMMTLSQGTHTLLITKREIKTKLDAFEFKPSVAADAPTVFDGTQAFEAESGDASGGMSVRTDDAEASDGKYVQADASGSMTYRVYVPTAGTYRVAGWVKAASGSSDSFRTSMGGTSPATWTLASPTSAWTYDSDDSRSYTLDAGVHMLVLQYREAGAKIDKLVLVKQ